MLSQPNTSIVGWKLEIQWENKVPVDYKIFAEWSDDHKSMEDLTDRWEVSDELSDLMAEYIEEVQISNQEINLTVMDGWHIVEDDNLPTELEDEVDNWFATIEHERNC